MQGYKTTEKIVPAGLHITCSRLGKRYNSQWVFRNMEDTFTGGEAISITGNNGSGKSTLLKVLAGFERHSEGTAAYVINGKPVDDTTLYRHVSICSPYQSLYDDFTAEEQFDLHRKFKAMRVAGFEEFSSLLALENIRSKPLKNYSSGMRQRVKLALAILSDTPLLFLDEPLTNLDASSTGWYRNLVVQHLGNRLVFVASNMQEDEFFFCQRMIRIDTLK
jgi:ABC-type multidrug transport system ATPase subunit